MADSPRGDSQWLIVGGLIVIALCVCAVPLFALTVLALFGPVVSYQVTAVFTAIVLTGTPMP